MKKFINLVIFILCLGQLSFAQQNRKFERVKDSIFIIDKGKRFVVDKNVVTVKPKSGVPMGGKNFRINRSNRLGYIDLFVPKDTDVESYVSLLEETGQFDVVEYNSVGEYCIMPNDSYKSSQWYLDRINVFSAWDITMGSSSIIVGILDSGTDWTHSDIGNGSDGYKNINESIGWNYESNNNNVKTANEHGTQVAGIVGAKTNNSRGIAGVSGGDGLSGITMLPICVGTSAPITSIIDDAIIYAVDNGARVIQLSLSVPETDAIKDAIAYAKQHNTVVICASSNDYSSTVSFPASHNDVIAVGAIDQNNYRVDFSNYGNALDVVAPGTNIYSTTLNNSYNSQNGTSFAAPIVSGIAALILSIRPDLTQAQVRHAIESSCTKLSGYSFSNNSNHPNGSWNDQVGHGLVNAYEAVKSVMPVISGPNHICTQGTYTIENLPAGASVTWSATYGISLSGTTGNSISAYNTTPSGRGFISATVSFPGLPDPISLSKPVLFGVPAHQRIASLRHWTFAENGENFEDFIHYSADPTVNFSESGIIAGEWESIPSGGVYHWHTYPSPSGYEGPINTNAMISVSYPGSNTVAKINARLRNQCGWSEWATIEYIKPTPPPPAGGKISDTITLPCKGCFEVLASPNPTSDELTVNFETLPSSEDQAEIYSVKLLDNSGQTRKQTNFKHHRKNGKAKSVKFNVSSLKDGTYYLHIEGAGKIHKEQIIINH